MKLTPSGPRELKWKNVAGCPGYQIFGKTLTLS